MTYYEGFTFGLGFSFDTLDSFPHYFDDAFRYFPVLGVAEQTAWGSQGIEEGESLEDAKLLHNLMHITERRTSLPAISNSAAAREFLKAFKELLKELETVFESRMDKRKNQSDSLSKEIYQMIGFYSVFQGTFFTALAQFLPSQYDLEKSFRSCIFRFICKVIFRVIFRVPIGFRYNRSELASLENRPLCGDAVMKGNLFLRREQRRQPYHETISKHAEGEMPDETLDSKDNLMSRFAPFFKKHIEDALEPVIGPVASILQGQGEDERKQRGNFLALEEKKLALRREKIQLKRRRAGRFQPTWRSSSAKSSQLTIQQGLRLKSRRTD